MPLISIIIPSYNYADYLPRAVESVLEQAFSDWELIIIDDGSSDETESVVQKYLRTDGRIQYIRQENAGVSVARNHGICLAKGDFILCLDADDALDPKALVHVFESISQHPQSKLHLGHYASISQKGFRKESRLLPESFESAENAFATFVRRQLNVAHGAFIVAREAFEQFQYPPGVTNGEDLVLFGHCLAQYPAVTIPHALVERYAHGGRARDNFAKIESMGLETVELLFDAEKLPATCMKYRDDFAARRLLSLARSYYLNGRYADASRCYHLAFKASPSALASTMHASRWMKSRVFEWTGRKKAA